MRKNNWVLSVLNFFVLFICIVTASNSLAFVEDTHREINKAIAKTTVDGFSLNSYLTNSLEFKYGSNEELTGTNAEGTVVKQTVFAWLGYGGIQEDRPGTYWDYFTNRPTRSANHFHNPLEPWAQAGLDDTFLMFHKTGQSSVLWAQNPNQDLGGRWSWPDARRYFYIALTGRNLDGTEVAKTNADKDAYYAYTFRAIGQLMHLVQDASVPEHVRNAIHIAPAYEAQIEEFRLRTDKYGSFWTDLLANPVVFDSSILDISSTEPSASVPICRIVDTDKYSGGNPDVTTTIFNLPQVVGIAEYTNANFLSANIVSTDTMFESDHFTYPRAIDTVAWVDNNNRTYLKKLVSGDVINHLAVTGFLYSYRQRYFPQYQKNLPVGLDTECYKDYAQKLIPRAVGYSAGLLNYFFRGSLEISAPDSYVYSITDGSKTPYIIQGAPSPHQQFTHIRAKVRNTTPKDLDSNGNPLTFEDMKDGTIQAVARYKIIPNYMPDLSNDPPDGAAMDAVSYSYSVSAPISISSISSTDLTEYTFDFTTNPIPAGITDLYLNVVFKGTLGGEKDISVAVGMKDLMEPTHFALWNLTDMFSLDYHLYTWDQIMATPDLAGKVDLNHNGTCCETGESYIKPYGIDYQIGFTDDPAANAVTVAAVNQLPPGRYVRLIALVDGDLAENYAQVVWSDPIDNDGTKFNAAFEGAVDQDYDGRIDTPAETFRQARQHFHLGTMRCTPLAYDQQGNGHCVYNEAEAIPANLEPVGLDIVFP